MLAGYCLWRDGARIVVCDGGGPGRPRLRESGGLAEGGRGLQVINALAARWDCFLLVGAQVVWCDFGQPLRAAPGDAWAWLRLVLRRSVPPARRGRRVAGRTDGGGTVSSAATEVLDLETNGRGSSAYGRLRVSARRASRRLPAGETRMARRMAGPSGAVPPADEGLITRPDTAPGLDAVLVPGAVVTLVPGQDAAGRARDWPGSSGKTQLACYLAGSLWRSRRVDLLAWVAATSRAAVLSGYVQAAAELGLDHGGDAEPVAARVPRLASRDRPAVAGGAR